MLSLSGLHLSGRNGQARTDEVDFSVISVFKVHVFWQNDRLPTIAISCYNGTLRPIHDRR
jgi:hypothetical protein